MSGIMLRASRHGLRWHVWVDMNGHRSTVVRKAWTRRGAQRVIRAWADEITQASDGQLLGLVGWPS